ncbi:carbohydrate ABC transporter permease [Actinopolymorpha singaporensis]|uniref:Carbohydrate ABC transporter membrane protein 1, CUT1 family n=1 Tax=Actinopolymorpha singaporensis TaxID=117157 RepID=A0A1H1R2L9_9ACTN|nr:sugar ABC transporter permease [Actinopolymorpha singaporensis]SDS29943.1 carbohydrate ABC transporter membrane protein 1, CUT1 family [Actinopolymorpha singaporensis]
MAEATLARRRPSRRPAWAGFAFSSPWIIGLVVFMAGPILVSLYYSFTEFNLFQSPRWVGLKNYATLLEDPKFLGSVFNTAYLAIIGVPLGLAFALLVALALNFPVRGQPLYRAIVYLPAIVPVVTASYLWRWVFNAQYGYLNQVLGRVGLPQPNWLADPLWTKPAVLIIIWWGIGATAVIYLAALKQVPQQLYEAAAVDGANGWQRFWYVTWPALTPVTLFQLIMGVIAALQIFAPTYLLTQSRGNGANGGPGDSLLTYTMHLFHNAFVFLKMGQAAAMAWILFLVIGLLTLLILLTSRRWVHYGSE